LAAFDICDSWDLRILGWAKNSKVEMGTYRFFECIDLKN
jgi:hypothetical protein